MKTGTFIFSLLGIMVLMSFQKTNTTQNDVSQKLIGTWVWKTVINGETKQDMGLDALTMGMVTEVKTEFKKDNTYAESKLRKGSTTHSTINDEWKVEGDDVLSLKAKDKWRPCKILKLANDSLLIQMNPKMHLLLIKQK